jgi:hypothetical protein
MDEILLTALIGSISGLIGVLIGSILSFVGQFFIFKHENERWKKEKRIELLKSKKGRLPIDYSAPLSDSQIDMEIQEIIDSK